VATTPVRETIEVRHRRTYRRVLTRAAWLTADVGAIAACVVVVLRALT
jgi:hypothetical protein